MQSINNKLKILHNYIFKNIIEERVTLLQFVEKIRSIISKDKIKEIYRKITFMILISDNRRFKSVLLNHLCSLNQYVHYHQFFLEMKYLEFVIIICNK